jgi:MtrB/PioB family decaheme-associated outer membrane protein
MRTRIFGMVAALLLVSAGAMAQDKPASAGVDQQSAPATGNASFSGERPASGDEFPLVNQIDIGIRGTRFGSNSDQARFQRYRDVRDGGTLDLLKFWKETDAYGLRFQADHIGYRDQRFVGSYNNYGRMKVSFEWNQIPLFYSQDTRTLYSEISPGVLTMSDAVQDGIQNKTTTLANAISGASIFRTDARRDIANVNLLYSATPNVDLTVRFNNTLRTGTQPYALSFGISNAIASEFAAPLDQRTSELGTSLQWSNTRGMVKLGYDGSFFRNQIPSLSVDNPQRVSDSATAGPAFGRLAGAPETSMNTGSAMAAIKLPAHSRATGYLAISNVTNNTALLPFTSNSAIAPIALDRPTADLTARVTSMNYNVTSSPTGYLWFSARYRQYAYDNRSPGFFVGQAVNWDTSIVTENEHAELLGFTRHTFDGDASVSPFKYVALRSGYTREEIDHANPSTGLVDRMVDKTVEDTGRLSLDLTNVGWLTLRGVYEHGKRVGSGLDLQVLIDIGEQPRLRQFDIADLTKDSFRAIAQVMPVSQVALNVSAGVGKEDYPGAYFGLRNNNNHVYSLGFDFVPVEAISMGINYGYEKYTALQASRTANPLPARTPEYLNDPTQQFNDPQRDWTDDSSDRVDTWDASIDLLKVIPRTEVRFGYDYSKAKSLYVYSLAPDTVIAAPIQLPALTSELRRGTADVRYFVTRHLVLGMVYWYDSYDVNDFALGPTPSLASPATATSTLMLLGYNYRPYTANTFWGRMTYLW